MARNFHILGRFAVLILVASGLAMAPAPAARAQMVPVSDLARPEEAADRAAIGALVAAQEAAWASHDMKAFASFYHEDCIMITWTGLAWHGRDAVEQGMAAVHKTVFRNSVQRKRIDGIRFLAPDVALVHLWGTLTGDERQSDKVVRSRNTLVLTKRDGEWKILAFQNTRLADSVPD